MNSQTVSAFVLLWGPVTNIQACINLFPLRYPSYRYASNLLQPNKPAPWGQRSTPGRLWNTVSLKSASVPNTLQRPCAWAIFYYRDLTHSCSSWFHAHPLSGRYSIYRYVPERRGISSISETTHPQHHLSGRPSRLKSYNGWDKHSNTQDHA